MASQKTAPGEQSRPRNSQTSTTCSGGFTELSSLANDHEGDLYGAPHTLALVISRYEGRFLNSTDSVAEWEGSYICDHHLDELSRKWSQAQYRHINWKSGKATCGHYDHHNHPVRSHGNFALTYDQSARILKEQGVMMQPGLALCRRHHEALLSKPDEEMPTVKDEPVLDDFDICYDDDKEKMDKSFQYTERAQKIQSPLQHHFEEYAKEAGATRFRCRKSYHELSYKGQYSKARVALLLENVTIEQLAGPSKESQVELSSLVRRLRDGKPTSNEDHETLTALLDDLNIEFSRARNAQERVHLISLFAKRVPYRILSHFVEHLSERLFYQSKKKALDSRSYSPPDHSRQRYNPTKLSHFISFLASPHIMIGIPYGEVRTKDSKGNTVTLPNYVRTTMIYETLNLYDNYLRQTGQEALLMSNSTGYRIIKSLPSMKSSSYSCVDYYSASSTMAFISIEKMLSDFDAHSLVDSTDVKFLKNSFEEFKQYLKGNFRLHLKAESVYSDHCLLWSLSDPLEEKLSAPPASHKHTHRSPECKKFDETVTGVKKMITELIKDTKDVTIQKKLKEHEHEFGLNVERIYDLKAHHVRTVMANKERERIISRLKNGQAFITLDYAQRFLPTYFRETQKQYFGKAGLSWHVSHVLANITGKFAQHSFITLLKDNDQNSTVVVEVIRHVLKHLKAMNLDTVFLRSDNAGYYHCSAALASIPDIVRDTGVKVASWTFSESQSGKSSSDRVAALVKRKIRDYVGKRNDVRTVDDMFTAITSGKLLKGVSVHLGTVHQKKLSSSKIDKISELGAFSFHGDKIRAWRFHGIGEGVEFSGLEPIKASFEIEKEGGKNASEGVLASDLAKIAKGEEPHFWFVPAERKYDEVHEIDDTDDDVASDRIHQNPLTAHAPSVFFCPRCGASFIRYSNLNRHIDCERCKKRPDRVSLLDYALGLFKGTLEDIQQAVALTPLSDSLKALQTGTDDELPKGWALRSTKKGVRYNLKAKQFVIDKFEAARTKGGKVRGEEVEILMKEDDSIAPHERMTLDQIKNCIRTLANNKTKKHRKIRSSRHAHPEPIYTDEDGLIEEEVEVPEEEHTYTDDDIYTYIHGHLDDYFTHTDDPEHSNGDIGDEFEKD